MPREESWTNPVTLIGLFIGFSIGLILHLIYLPMSLGDVDFFGRNFSMSTPPWFYFTIYSIGLVFISYYLGGVLNSRLLSEEEYNCNNLLRLKTQLLLLPISHFIRRDRRKRRIKREYIGKIKNLKFSEHSNLLVESILDGYIFPWYNIVSDEKKIFPAESKEILTFILNGLREKVQQIDRTALTTEIIQVIHAHWHEYCEAIKKIKSPNELLIQKFKFMHPCVKNADELRCEYESLVRVVLPPLLPPPLSSSFISLLLSSILVKGVLTYYTSLLSSPSTLNKLLISTLFPRSSSPGYNNGDLSSTTHSNVSSAPHSPLPQQGEEEFQHKCPSVSEGRVKEAPLSNFLTIDKKSEVKKSSSTGSSPVLSTIQTALSGLLSATALPLLPDISPSNLNEILPDISPINLNEELTHELIIPPPHLELDTKKILSKEKAGRTASWEGLSGNRSKVTTPNTATKSLDESLTLLRNVGRGDEFDFDENCKNVKEEEGEDFAATIAKLRSLLEQRQSQTNLIQKEKDETDTSCLPPNLYAEQPIERETEAGSSESKNNKQGLTKTHLTKIRPSLDSQSSASSLTSEGSAISTFSHNSNSIETEKMEKIDDEEEEEGGGPIISRLFLNVSIIKTESCIDSSGNFMFYCIQYEGVYIDENEEDYSPKLVLRTTTVKRSFKEFLLLQTQLEESPIWRPHLRGIKTPLKWLNLSFNNRSQRTSLLENYLQQVCYSSVLGFSPEVRHFMAYGDDGFQVFGLTPFGTPHPPRFDKLTKTFTGVFNSLREALPSFESDLQPNNSNGENSNGGSNNGSEGKTKRLLPSFLHFGEKRELEEEQKSVSSDKNSTEQMAEVKILDFDDGTMSTDETDSEPKKSPDEESDDQIPSILSFKDELSRTDSSGFEGMYPVASAMTKFLCDVLWLPNQRPHSASVSAVMSVSGKSIENYLQETLDILLSQDAFLGYMDLLTLSIREWTRGGGGGGGGVDEKTDIEQEVYTVEDLKFCMKKKVPIWVRWMWGRNRLDLSIERLAGFFQIQLLNQDLILTIIKLIFSKLNTSCDNDSC